MTVKMIDAWHLTRLTAKEVEAIKRDVPKAEVHVLDAGHFALDEAAGDIAKLMRTFLGRAPHAARKAAGSAT